MAVIILLMEKISERWDSVIAEVELFKKWLIFEGKKAQVLTQENQAWEKWLTGQLRVDLFLTNIVYDTEKLGVKKKKKNFFENNID